MADGKEEMSVFSSCHLSSVIRHQQSNRTIGLLGGSFNPAHEGHVHITQEALRRLRVDEVWWLVSPHNPLKSRDELSDYADRVATASQLVQGRKRIRVTDIERELGTRYTVDTLRALTRRYPRTTFIWLMGADNLETFHRWQHWQDIMREYAVAVFDRAPYSFRALHAKAALRFHQQRVEPGELAGKPLPAWSFLHLRRDPHSATAIRKRLEKR